MPNARADDRLRSSLALAETFSGDYLREYGVLPLGIWEGTLHVACTGTPLGEVLDHLQRAYRVPVRPVPVAQPQLEEAIEAATGALHDGQEPEDSAPDAGSDPWASQAVQPTVIRLVDTLLRDAVAARASDVHLEATEEGLLLRRRVDGSLSRLPSPPRALHAAVISRLKLMAEMDIAEQRRPQDGHLRLSVEGVTIDVRVSSVPTVFGESLVLRLLDARAVPRTLDALGFTPDAIAILTHWASLPHGLVLTTGPTGSGKTTTLHRLLELRAGGADKVITVEDPVEYTVPGVTQVPVLEAAGVTFTSVLRSVLRQDPDVVMVGEMRDSDTARIAVRAALTGHLVLSTLHTNDAASAVARLRDLGVQDFLIAATLRGVIAQRLVRALCPDCRRQHGNAEADAWEAVGCDACRGTGYRGRVAVFELLAISEDIRFAIARGASLPEIERLAVASGFTSIARGTAARVAAGITSLEEARRVLGEETQ